MPRVRLRGLHRLLQTIRDAGVQTVAVPLVSDEGCTTLLHQETIWQLEPWMTGTADFRSNPSRERLQSAMAALADWHRAARRFPAENAEREWFRCEPNATSPAVIERLQKVLKWQRGRLLRLRHVIDSQQPSASTESEFGRLGRIVMSRFDSIGETIAVELRKATDLRVDIHPCLRDIWHDHVLFNGNQVTGMIDPSACRCDTVATDLARLLGSLIQDDREMWSFGLQCYEQHRPLSGEEHRLVQVLDRSSVLLSGLTWLDRYYLQHRAFSDIGAVVERLQQIVVRLEHMQMLG